MKDGMLVFDSVVHMYDNRPTNVTPGEGIQVMNNLHAVAAAFATPDYPANDAFVDRMLSTEEAHALLFEASDTDIAMAQAVPLFGWWKDGFSPVERNHAFATAYPDKVIFCGAVDPIYQGLDGALAEMERQVNELGARSFKFYQAHSRGLSWRLDDRKLAYPLYEKALELGVGVVQFHKGVPFGSEHLQDLAPFDVQDAASDFPDLTFVLHHLGEPFINETINIAARWPNVWLALSFWINQHPVAPREALHRIGKALMYVGPDRLVWGSEAFIQTNVQGYIDLFADMEMPEDLQDGYGYPALTREVKEKIFGLNFAHLLGIKPEDVEAGRLVVSDR